MMPWEIRAARPEDIEAMAALDLAGNPLAWSASAMRDELTSPWAMLWCAVAPGDRVIGFCIVHLLPPDAELLEIAVDPTARRQGVGGALVQVGIEEARRRGCMTMCLEVRIGNQAAQSVYHRAGFEEVGLRPRCYRDNGEDAVVMRLDLQAPQDLDPGSGKPTPQTEPGPPEAS
jgi:ribosomal-protein-alanine N-acetyltransferase